MAAVLIFQAAGGVAGQVPARAASSVNFCEYGALIGVRGTNSPAGEGSLHSGRVYASGGWGTLGVIRNLLERYGSAPLQAFALAYPASSIGFVDSLKRGRDNLVEEMNWLVQQCGSFTPALVLVGFSQGAAVVEAALTTKYDGSPNLSERAKTALVAAAVIADMFYTPNEPYNAPTATTNGTGRLGGWSPEARREIASYSYWGFPPPGGSQGTVYKVRAWCSTDDYWCASSDAQEAHTVHANAATDNATSVKDWIEYMTTAF